MNQTTTAQLPAPSAKHSTCAWCRKHFDTIVQLIDHVDHGHLEPEGNAPHLRAEAA